MKDQLPPEKTHPAGNQLTEKALDFPSRQPGLVPMNCPLQETSSEAVNASHHLSEELKQLRKAYRQLQLERDMLRKAFFVFHENKVPLPVSQQDSHIPQ